MKKLFFILMILLSIEAMSQTDPCKYYFLFGGGTSLLGTGDMKTLMFENEADVILNHYAAFGISIGYGRSNRGVYETASFVQGNLNGYISPFRNNRKNDFRIGAGLGLMNISDARAVSSIMVDGEIYDDYGFRTRNAFGVNIVLEDNYSITERFTLGIKLFTLPYKGDINSGVLFRLGVKI